MGRNPSLTCAPSSDRTTNFYFHFSKQKIYISRYILIQNARRTLLLQLPEVIFFRFFFHVIQWWFVICPTFLPPPTLLQPPSDIHLTPNTIVVLGKRLASNQFKLHDWYTISTGVKFTNRLFCVWSEHSVFSDSPFHSSATLSCKMPDHMHGLDDNVFYSARADTHNYTIIHTHTHSQLAIRNQQIKCGEHMPKSRDKKIAADEKIHYTARRAKKGKELNSLWCDVGCIASLGHYLYAWYRLAAANSNRELIFFILWYK